MRYALALTLTLVCIGSVAAGCGSSKKTAPTTTAIVRVLPDARTPDEWALRIVDILLRPLNKDLNVVTNFDNPQIRLFIANGNPTTLQIINTRMNDLKRCSGKLVQIGPPPPGNPRLKTIATDFERACADYVRVADTLLRATPFLASGRTDVMKQGDALIRAVKPASGRAADNLAAAIRLAQTLPAFRRAGLRPSI